MNRPTSRRCRLQTAPSAHAAAAIDRAFPEMTKGETLEAERFVSFKTAVQKRQNVRPPPVRRLMGLFRDQKASKSARLLATVIRSFYTFELWALFDTELF